MSYYIHASEGTSDNFIAPQERSRLIHLCATITGNYEVAEDLAQETLLEAWRHLEGLQDPTKRSQWLTGIARNVCLRWNRQRGKNVARYVSLEPHSVHDDGSIPEETFADDFDWVLLLPILPLLIAVYAIAGLGNAPLNPLVDTILQERVPPEMRARVFGTTTAGAYIGIPIGSILGSFLVSWLGIQVTVAAMGALYLLTTLSLLINPALKKMDR